MFRYIINIFAIIGILLIIIIFWGIGKDFASFDRTKGGYEPPYTEYTGAPINWNEGDFSNEGFARRGRVFNTLLNCTTGMISFQIFGKAINFRKVSARAIAVHKPREACQERGFTPEF